MCLRLKQGYPSGSLMVSSHGGVFRIADVAPCGRTVVTSLAL